VNPQWGKSKEFTPRHLIIKLLKTQTKRNVLKTAHEKWCVMCRRTPIQITAVFSSETMKASKKWRNIFQVLKEKNINHKFYIQSDFLPKGKRVFYLQVEGNWETRKSTLCNGSEKFCKQKQNLYRRKLGTSEKKNTGTDQNTGKNNSYVNSCACPKLHLMVYTKAF
jgi:hypothetical protein